jgi:hypothetical protein
MGNERIARVREWMVETWRNQASSRAEAKACYRDARAAAGEAAYKVRRDYRAEAAWQAIIREGPRDSSGWGSSERVALQRAVERAVST